MIKQDGLRKAIERSKAQRAVMRIVAERVLSIIVAGDVLACGEHEIVQARSRVRVPTEKFIDGVVFESDVQDPELVAISGDAKATKSAEAKRPL